MAISLVDRYLKALADSDSGAFALSAMEQTLMEQGELPNLVKTLRSRIQDLETSGRRSDKALPLRKRLVEILLRMATHGRDDSEAAGNAADALAVLAEGLEDPECQRRALRLALGRGAADPALRKRVVDGLGGSSPALLELQRAVKDTLDAERRASFHFASGLLHEDAGRGEAALSELLAAVRSFAKRRSYVDEAVRAALVQDRAREVANTLWEVGHASTVSAEARAYALSKVGLLLAQQLHDEPGALTALTEALALDGTLKAARRQAEKLAHKLGVELAIPVQPGSPTAGPVTAAPPSMAEVAARLSGNPADLPVLDEATDVISLEQPPPLPARPSKDYEVLEEQAAHDLHGPTQPGDAPDGAMDPDATTVEEMPVVTRRTEFAPGTTVGDLLKAGRPEDAVDLLLLRLTHPPRIPDLLMLADIYEDSLKDAAHALEYYGKAARRLAERGDNGDLQLSLAVQGAIRVGTGDPMAFAQLADDLRGKLSADAQDRLERAVATAAFATHPLLSGSRWMRLFVESTPPDRALFDEADRAYASASDRMGQANLRRVARKLTTDGRERLRLAREVADLLKPQGAREYATALKEVLEEDPRDEATMERLVLTLEQARARGEHVTSELSDALKLVAGLRPGEAGVPNLRRLAKVRDEAGDLEGTVNAWREVLSRRAEDAEALRQLTDLAERMGYDDDLAAILETRIHVARAAKDAPGEAKLLNRLAALRDQQGDQTARMRLLRQVLMADPDDPVALPLVESYYRETRAFAPLADLYEELSTRRAWSGARTAARLAAAAVNREQLHRPQRARELIQQVLDAEPDHPQALLEMALVTEEMDEKPRAAECLARAAKGLKGAARADALTRLGVLQESLGRAEEGAASFRQALNEDEGYRPAMEGLLRLAKETGRTGEVRTLAAQLAAMENDPAKRAESLLSLARKSRDGGEAEAAVRLYEQALVVDPSRLDGTEELCWLLVNRGEGRKARTHLERLVRLQGEDKVPPPLLVALARTQAAVGETQVARERLQAALRQDLLMLDALRTLGELLLADKEEPPRNVLEVVEKLLRHHADKLERAELSSLHASVGKLKRRMNDARGARAALEKALELMPPDKPDVDTLVHLGQLAEESERPDDALELFTRVAKLLRGREAAEYWAKVGMLWARKGNTAQAQSALAEARRLDPTREDAARALEEIDADANSPTSVKLLKEQLGKEKDRRRQSELHLSIARVYRKPPMDNDRAVSHLQQSLEADATNAEALKLVEQVLADKRDSRGLVEVYTHVLRDLPETATLETRVGLLEKVVALRRFDLRDLPGAIQALEEILKLDEDHLKSLEDLARLHLEMGNKEAALSTWRELLRRSPAQVDAYRGLLSAQRRCGDLDAAYCLCATLTALEEADEETRGVARALRPPFPSWPKPVADEDAIWRRVVHPLCRGPARELMAALTPYVLPLFLKPLRDAKLGARDQIDLDMAPSSIALAARHAGRLLGLSPPVLYRGDSSQPGITLVPLDPPGLRLGPQTLRGGMTPERAFLFGRWAAYLRPEGLLHALLGLRGVGNLLEAAVLRARPHAEVRGTWQEVDRMAKDITPRIPVRESVRISQLTHAFLDHRDESTAADLAVGYALTADRIGFLFAQDLAACLAMIREHPENHVATGTRAAIRELVLFSVSPELATLRVGLGITVDSRAAAQALGERA